MKVALDTNILAYAEATNGAAMRERALELIQRLPPDAIVLVPALHPLLAALLTELEE